MCIKISNLNHSDRTDLVFPQKPVPDLCLFTILIYLIFYCILLNIYKTLVCFTNIFKNLKLLKLITIPNLKTADLKIRAITHLRSEN